MIVWEQHSQKVGDREETERERSREREREEERSRERWSSSSNGIRAPKDPKTLLPLLNVQALNSHAPPFFKKIFLLIDETISC